MGMGITARRDHPNKDAKRAALKLVGRRNPFFLKTGPKYRPEAGGSFRGDLPTHMGAVLCLFKLYIE